MTAGRYSDITKLIVSIVVCASAGWFGSIFTTAAVPAWYATLQKPVFAPPNWLFAPVWTILYIMMAVAAWLVWRQGMDKKPVRLALLVFLVQLILNALWSFIFFGLRSIAGGEVIIILLWVVLLLTIIVFWRLSRTAAWLLVPYLLWITFATALNIAVLMLNT